MVGTFEFFGMVFIVDTEATTLFKEHFPSNCVVIHPFFGVTRHL
jgi:hypothetical protein